MPQEKVLIVDDEEAVRSIVAALLGRSGFAPIMASGAEDALLRLQANPDVDLVLSDVMMSGTDGLTLLDRIVIDYPAVPVVMFSAVHDIHVATSAFRRGAVDYLLKPFERSQLITVVTRATEHGRLRRQNAAYRENLEEMVTLRTRSLRAAMQDLERSYDITIEAMGDALDLRDAETEGHSRRVTAYTTALAREMGLAGEPLRIIARGAFLHDIGKIATPDSVLLKPGRLSLAETEIMRQHCDRGYAMIRKIPFLRDASEIVYTHQERFDGTGYPRGLKGNQIPLGSRLFAIADTLDAITSDRPYRVGRSFADAVDEIAFCSGTQFDPVIVEVFLKIPPQRWSELRAEIARMAPALISSTLCRPARAVA
jgi:putative nucleotidyltransferase with HDIG domain